LVVGTCGDLLKASPRVVMLAVGVSSSIRARVVPNPQMQNPQKGQQNTKDART